MKDGKLIALSAVSTALGVIFLIIGAYIETFDLSALFMSAIAIMLPLSKNSVKGALFTYGATALLSFCFALSRFYVPLLYVLFFGIHPIINYIQLNSKKNLWFLYVIKGLWFIGIMFIMYYSFTLFIVEIESIKKFMPVIITVLGAMMYVAYDFVMIRFQKMSFNIIKRLGL